MTTKRTPVHRITAHNMQICFFMCKNTLKKAYEFADNTSWCISNSRDHFFMGFGPYSILQCDCCRWPFCSPAQAADLAATAQTAARGNAEPGLLETNAGSRMGCRSRQLDRPEDRRTDYDTYYARHFMYIACMQWPWPNNVPFRYIDPDFNHPDMKPRQPRHIVTPET